MQLTSKKEIETDISEFNLRLVHVYKVDGKK